VKTLDARRLVAIRRQRGLVAIFDLDGALAPIAPTPESARVSSTTRRALRALARRADTTVGVVSGRHLYQVERLIGAGGLWIAGLHGYVRRAPAGRVERLVAADRATGDRARGRPADGCGASPAPAWSARGRWWPCTSAPRPRRGGAWAFAWPRGSVRGRMRSSRDDA
jgi:hypothetical protein